MASSNDSNNASFVAMPTGVLPWYGPSIWIELLSVFTLLVLAVGAVACPVFTWLDVVFPESGNCLGSERLGAVGANWPAACRGNSRAATVIRNVSLKTVLVMEPPLERQLDGHIDSRVQVQLSGMFLHRVDSVEYGLYHCFVTDLRIDHQVIERSAWPDFIEVFLNEIRSLLVHRIHLAGCLRLLHSSCCKAPDFFFIWGIEE